MTPVTERRNNAESQAAVAVGIDARLFGAVLAFELAKDMFAGSLWILSPHSITGRIAALSTYPEAIAVVWFCLAVLVVPYFLLQAFSIGQRHAKIITRTACRAILAGGVIWCYLAYLSRNLDYAFVTEIFVIAGLACIAMAAALANSLNNAQRRAQGDAP